ncbi:MAG: hypothetical protein ACREIK_04025, partial [Nitrospiraceae bacterium]
RLDKHRESLTKYAYDLSKVTIAIIVLNPLVTKPFSASDLALGLFAGLAFLVLAILIEWGGSP